LAQLPAWADERRAVKGTTVANTRPNSRVLILPSSILVPQLRECCAPVTIYHRRVAGRFKGRLMGEFFCLGLIQA
jgi:hypothetical protein